MSSRPLAAALAALGVLAASVAGAADGTSPGLDRVVDRLEQAYAAAADLTAKFQQTSSIASVGQTQKASGIVYVKRPGKMRWEYAEPEPRLYVTDGKTFWAYSPEDKQVLIQEVGGALAATPLAFLMGSTSLRKEFKVGEVRHAGTGHGKTALLDLQPLRPEAAVKRLVLEVDLATALVVQATVFDPVGNTIVLTLADQQLNVGVPETRFTFTPPPGTQVLKGPVAPGGRR